MKPDINFLYDDSVLEKEKLEEIMKELNKKPKKINHEAVFLRKFILAMYKAAEKKKFSLKKEVKVIKKEISEPKKEIKKEKPKEKLPTPIPEYPEYPVIRTHDNFVLVRVELKNHIYNIKEPILDEKEKGLLVKLKDKIGSKIESKPDLINDQKFLEKFLVKFSKKLDLKISNELYRKIHYYLVKQIIDYGKISVLLRDHNIKEINCKSYKDPVLVNYNNFKDVKTTLKFESHDELRELIKKFFDKAGIKLTKENNYLDTDKLGFSVKATYDLTGEESKFEIRKEKEK